MSHRPGNAKVCVDGRSITQFGRCDRYSLPDDRAIVIIENGRESRTELRNTIGVNMNFRAVTFPGVILMAIALMPGLAVAQEGRQAEKLVFELPASDGWDRGESRAFADKDAGFSVAYDSTDPAITVTLYQYSAGLDSIPDDVESNVVKKEMEGMQDGINQAKRLGYYDEVVKKEAKTVQLDGSKVKALWCRFAIESRGEKTNSQCFMTTCKNRFIKIRITYAENDSEAAEKKLNRLLAGIGKAIEVANEM